MPAKIQSDEIRKFLLDHIPDHPRDIVTLAMERFGVSRPAVHQHLNRLIREHQVIKTGRTKAVHYSLTSSLSKHLVFNLASELEEHAVWNRYLKDAFSILPDNVVHICEYAFGEIFNNAIDHSEGTRVEVITSTAGDKIRIEIKDDGIGIFRKIQNALNLENERESILHLSKGKLTTDQARHTGEGIFFTSRAVDEFYLWSGRFTYCRGENDWFLEVEDKPFKGTNVVMFITMKSSKTLEGVFRQFTREQEDGVPRFDKTHITIALSEQEEERFISRSQAKRILVGLEKFKEVVLDFKDVKTVGQGFVDEVFRIFQNRHPHIRITYTNANENVEFMIKRSIPPRA